MWSAVDAQDLHRGALIYPSSFMQAELAKSTSGISEGNRAALAFGQPLEKSEDEGYMTQRRRRRIKWVPSGPNSGESLPL